MVCDPCGDSPVKLVLFKMLQATQATGTSAYVPQMEKAGYIPTAHFILPENCWPEHFYALQFPVQEAFLKEYAGNEAAADFIAGQRHEESLYNKYKEYYGYVFYIGQKR